MRTLPTSAPLDGLAAEIAVSPGLIDRLLAEHADDGTGHCRTCTRTPGYGSRDVASPCSIRSLAQYAARSVR